MEKTSSNQIVIESLIGEIRELKAKNAALKKRLRDGGDGDEGEKKEKAPKKPRACKACGKLKTGADKCACPKPEKKKKVGSV